MNRSTRESLLIELPSFAEMAKEVRAKEEDGGWLTDCIEANRYLAVNREVVAALGQILTMLQADLGTKAHESPIVEVCAGSGLLAAALRAEGHDVCPTDAKAPPNEHGVDEPKHEVVVASAAEAVARFHPAVVLGVFVPEDGSIHETVLNCSAVGAYVVLGGAAGGESAFAGLIDRVAGWTVARLPAVQQWMITRHDFVVDASQGPLVRRGEAWLLRREPCELG